MSDEHFNGTFTLKVKMVNKTFHVERLFHIIKIYCTKKQMTNEMKMCIMIIIIVLMIYTDISLFRIMPI
jgi:hypothetical protein